MMASDSSGVVSPLTAAPTALTPSSSTTKMTRTCSLCGINGHNSRTCTDSSGSGTGGAASGGGGVMLFGVNLTDVGAAGGAISCFRKSASMTNLSQLDKQVHDGSADAATGYASDDALHTAGRSQRKRGVPWTEEEHKMFLLGLNTVGKGDWRGISKNFVKSRTPTQVASHAQKYFLRRINHNRRRRRSSLFDITADTVMDLNEEQLQQEQVAPSKPPLVQTTKTSTNFRMNLFQAPPLPTRAGESINSATALLLPPVPVPPSLKMADLNLNESPELISLDNPPLSLSPPTVPARDDQSEGSGRHSTAKSLQSVGLTGSGLTGSGDSMISVA